MNALRQITPFQYRAQSMLGISFFRTNNVLHIVFVSPIVYVLECFDRFQGLHLHFGNGSIGDDGGGIMMAAGRRKMLIGKGCRAGGGGRGKNHSHDNIRRKF